MAEGPDVGLGRAVELFVRHLGWGPLDLGGTLGMQGDGCSWLSPQVQDAAPGSCVSGEAEAPLKLWEIWFGLRWRGLELGGMEWG